MDFDSFGLSEPVAEALRRIGLSQPTSIQVNTIPPLMARRDVFARGESGSGKTYAFGIPLVEHVDPRAESACGLVLCAGREHAYQVVDDLEALGRVKGVRVAAVTPGEHARTQIMRLSGKHVVVAIPARFNDLVDDRLLDPLAFDFVVLDELDKMIDVGAGEDLRRLATRLRRQRVSVAVTSSITREVQRHADLFLNHPVVIEPVARAVAASGGRIRAVRTKSARKLALLEKLLSLPGFEDQTFLVFCNTSREVRHVDRELWVKSLTVAALAGDTDQGGQQKVLERFKSREIRILVITDAALRGVELEHVGHVVNFDVPFEIADFVQRTARTARTGRDGLVTTFIGDEDVHAFNRIRRELGQDFEMLPETLIPAPPQAPAAEVAKPVAAEERAARQPRRAAAQAAERPHVNVVERSAETDARHGDEDSGPPPANWNVDGEWDVEESDDFAPDDYFDGDIDAVDDDDSQQGGGSEGPAPTQRNVPDDRSTNRPQFARGRRGRADYKKWEEDQLNKPVDLVADNWDSVDEIDSLRPRRPDEEGGEGDGVGGDEERPAGERKPDEERDRGRRRRGGQRRAGRGAANGRGGPPGTSGQGGRSGPSRPGGSNGRGGNAGPNGPPGPNGPQSTDAGQGGGRNQRSEPQRNRGRRPGSGGQNARGDGRPRRNQRPGDRRGGSGGTDGRPDSGRPPA